MHFDRGSMILDVWHSNIRRSIGFRTITRVSSPGPQERPQRTVLLAGSSRILPHAAMSLPKPITIVCVSSSFEGNTFIETGKKEHRVLGTLPRAAVSPQASPSTACPWRPVGEMTCAADTRFRPRCLAV